MTFLWSFFLLFFDSLFEQKSEAKPDDFAKNSGPKSGQKVVKKWSKNGKN